jgi:hypothetical protein
MVEYTCEKCGKMWNRKSVYQQHLKRKKPCIVIDEANDDIKNKGNDEINKKIDFLVLEIEKINKNMELLSKENKILKNKIKKIESNEKSSNVYMDVENFVVNNGINIVEFGKEKWNFLTNEEKLKILDGGFKSVQRYVQLVHMNKEKPEYSNIYVKNWKDSKGGVMINDGNEWIRCKNEVIDDLRDRGIDFVDITHEYLKSKDLLPEHIDKKIERFAKELDGDNGEELRKKISSDIKLDLYNYGKKKAIK